MQFSIPCETIVRLSNVTKTRSARHNDIALNCIRVETINHNLLAITTNGQIAAFEYFGDVDTDANQSVQIALEPALINQCQMEIAFGGRVEIVVNDMLKFASAKTTLGYSFPGNIAQWEVVAPLENWRDWAIVKPVVKSRGAMFMNTEDITNLGLSAPSGRIAFPEFIDASKPVIVRDTADPKWVGMFMPNIHKDDGTIVEAEPAKLPEWIK